MKLTTIVLGICGNQANSQFSILNLTVKARGTVTAWRWLAFCRLKPTLRLMRQDTLNRYEEERE